MKKKRNDTTNWWRKRALWNAKSLLHLQKIFSKDKNDKNVFKLYHKVRDICHYTEIFKGASHSICNWRYKTLKEISVVFHSRSAYDYHFIINHLEKELDV